MFVKIILPDNQIKIHYGVELCITSPKAKRVIMGDIDVTSNCLSNGVIFIPSVTEDVVIHY